jgi:hypothetical protein
MAHVLLPSQLRVTRSSSVPYLLAGLGDLGFSHSDFALSTAFAMAVALSPPISAAKEANISAEMAPKQWF